MRQALLERIPEAWTDVELLADSLAFTVKLTSDIRTLDGEVIFKAKEKFNVYPAIIRHGEKMYEVADGYAKGFMLPVSECVPTFAD